jgi:serine protease Do
VQPAVSTVWADDAPTAAAVTSNIERLFAGAAPSGIADLKAMQSHVQKLVTRLTQCTVGVEVGYAQGSGVIVSKDGYVLTAAHVASPPRRRGSGQSGGDVPVTFHLSDGRKVTGKVLGLNRTLDAGLLKITEPGEYPHAELGASGTLKDGQWCVAMGHPGGYQDDRGVVLRLGRVMLASNDAITTDCTLVGGDSGGPLFDMDGRVIGINSRIAESLAANIHVPVSTYQEGWDRLVKGEVWGHTPGREPYLGVKGAPEAKDAKIASIEPDSPAARAGLKPNDVIVRFGNKDITDFASLRTAVVEQDARSFRRGPPLKMKVRRGEEVLELEVRLGFRDN